MKLKTLTALLLCTASTQLIADNKPYWSGSDGDYARGRDGYCVRTITWIVEDSIASCEGGKAEAKAVIAVKEAVVEKEMPEVVEAAKVEYTI